MVSTENAFPDLETFSNDSEKMEQLYEDIAEHLPGEQKKTQEQLQENLVKMYESVNVQTMDEDFAVALTAWREANKEKMEEILENFEDPTPTMELCDMLKKCFENNSTRGGLEAKVLSNPLKSFLGSVLGSSKKGK